MNTCQNCQHEELHAGSYPCDPCVGYDHWEPKEVLSASAKQVGGDHYSKLPIQPFKYAMANKLDPLQHTAVKYVTRFRDKNGRADLEKAIHTIELLIQHEYGGGL